MSVVAFVVQPRMLIVVALLVGFVVAQRLWAQRQHRLRGERPAHPSLPAVLLDGAERTWVLFTTPYCASCGPVEADLREAEPTSRVVKVDATAEPGLAHAFHVRSAPTVLLADPDGEVRERFVGADQVRAYLAAARA